MQSRMIASISPGAIALLFITATPLFAMMGGGMGRGSAMGNDWGMSRNGGMGGGHDMGYGGTGGHGANGRMPVGS